MVSLSRSPRTLRLSSDFIFLVTVCSLLLSPIWQLRNGCSEEVHKLLKVMWPSASLESSRSQPPDSSLPHTVHLCPGACLFLAASRFVDLTGLHDSLCVDFSLAVFEVLREDLTEVFISGRDCQDSWDWKGILGQMKAPVWGSHAVTSPLTCPLPTKCPHCCLSNINARVCCLNRSY